MRPRHCVTAVLFAVIAASGGNRRAGAQTVQSDSAVEAIARQLLKPVEAAVGLPFKRPPRLAVRTKAQVRDYLEHKLEQDLPPPELSGLTAAYRLFGLIPDTLDLKQTLLALLGEQVAGYYDPDSATLYVVKGTMADTLRLVLAHELVHALQGQYVPLQAILDARGDNDRRTAAQAVMEGQAMFSSLAVMAPGQDLDDIGSFWRGNRGLIQSAQAQMPVFSSAPRILRETLVFPYFAGADFVRWFSHMYRDTVPFGPRLPASTEQILHPDRYRRGDQPIALRLSRAPGDSVIWEDNLGEFEASILFDTLAASDSLGEATATGWGGDRYVVLRSGESDALVWYSVWDSPHDAAQVVALLSRTWARAHPGAARRSAVEALSVDGHPGVRLVDAPASWPGWRALPMASVARR